MGNPVLRRIASRVEDPKAPFVAELLADMREKLAESGGIGLAAPQIAELHRVILVSVPKLRTTADEDDGEMPVTALINPEITAIGEEVSLGWEGCLSIPGWRGKVPRWQRLELKATLEDGSLLETVISGMRARVVQHEVDHLDGVLYLDRMQDFKDLGFTEEIMEAKLAEREGEG